MGQNYRKGIGATNSIFVLDKDARHRLHYGQKTLRECEELMRTAQFMQVICGCAQGRK